MNEPKYKYIRAWGRKMGSYDHYIDRQITKAWEDNAPADAVYWSTEKNRWIRFSEFPIDTYEHRWLEQAATEITKSNQ